MVLPIDGKSFANRNFHHGGVIDVTADTADIESNISRRIRYEDTMPFRILDVTFSHGGCEGSGKNRALRRSLANEKPVEKLGSWLQTA